MNEDKIKILDGRYEFWLESERDQLYICMDDMSQHRGLTPLTLEQAAEFQAALQFLLEKAKNAG